MATVINTSSRHLVGIAVSVSLVIAGCVAKGPPADKTELLPYLTTELTVTLDPDSSPGTVAEHAFGIHASVYDNALHDPELGDQLREAGVTLMRWPGGGYSDNYHWSDHSMTPWYSDAGVPRGGYLARGTDFGSFVSVIDGAQVTAMITVNYGSNLQGEGPGEPKEAAAWVAYANGDPNDETVIGVDGAGNDWQTVGYWASLRASEPLDQDDGRNFLRIGRTDPVGIRYWEIGNEIFGNGYYPNAFELDLHAPYGTDVERLNNPALSPTTYGKGVVEYIDAMKAVDPNIQVGAVLVTPPSDYSWAPTWNDDVLKECGSQIDFGIIHFYPTPNSTNAGKVPKNQVPEIAQLLRQSLDEYCGDRAEQVGLALTEVGLRASSDGYIDPMSVGLYAADSYLTFSEQGFMNVDWLELHQGDFLSERDQSEGVAYKGISMAHRAAVPGSRWIAASSNSSDLSVHATLGDDGTLSLALVNPEPATLLDVWVDLQNMAVAQQGQRWDFSRDPEATDDEGNIVGPVSVSQQRKQDAFFDETAASGSGEQDQQSPMADADHLGVRLDLLPLSMSTLVFPPES